MKKILTLIIIVSLYGYGFAQKLSFEILSQQSEYKKVNRLKVLLKYYHNFHLMLLPEETLVQKVSI